MDDDTREVLLGVCELAHRQFLRIYDLEASVAALKSVALPGIGPEAALEQLETLENKWKESQPQREGLEQVEATIRLLKQARDPGKLDS